MRAGPSPSTRQIEIIIEKGKNIFIEVGLALREIRDGKLYKENYRTFEEYCQNRWNWRRAYVNRLVAASKVAESLAPVGAKLKNEWRAREFTRLNPEDIQPVASEIDLSTATATEVKKVVENLATPSNRKPKAERLESIRALAARGYRDSQIAKELGLSPDRVRELATEGEIKLT